MKRILTITLLLCSLLISACDNTNTEVIGGADGPTSIIVNDKGQFGEQIEKRPVRMFNIDGNLYYDTGLVSENTPRCGTMDGKLKKIAEETEIPLKSGGANFDVDGYQNATTTTKEVNVGGEWVIFKKYDTYGNKISNLKYCHYIKGHLNNAVADSEIIVLSEEENVTFNDVYEPLLSSQSPAGTDSGKILFNPIVVDEWGIRLLAQDVTPKGMTLRIEQFGANPSGSLEFGAEYTLERNVDGNWKKVKTKTGGPLAWNMLGYSVKMNDITEIKIDWEYGYGKLEPGEYRLKKEIMDFRAAGDYDKKTYEAYFTIE